MALEDMTKQELEDDIASMEQAIIQYKRELQRRWQEGDGDGDSRQAITAQ